MVVSYHNPGILIIGGLAAAILSFIAFRLRVRKDDRDALRVANTRRLKELPLYRSTLIKIRILRILAAAGLILSLVAALFLTARPYRRETVKDTVNRRDIFLCIDLSSSSSRGVQALVEDFKEVVSSLDGDRIGISLFNTSSIQYVPMTDDYDFVQGRLDELAAYFAAAEEFATNYADKYDSVYDIPESERERYDELNGILAAFDEGVTAGYELKGTSAIGEGLASCLFSFPELVSEKRTRVIFFITDNHPELLDDPLVTLEDAAEMCRFDNVSVIGIYPGSGAPAGGQASGESQAAGTPEDEIRQLQAAAESTGGRFYGSGDSVTAQEMLSDIDALKSKDTTTATANIDTDMPQFWTYLLIAGVVLLTGTTAFFVLKRGIRKGRTSRKVTAAVLLLLMIAGTAVVFIRPMYLSPSAEIMTSNLDVTFVVDTTISMWAEDGTAGTRIDSVKKDIREIVGALPGSNFSLIRFDNGAQIMIPYTQDISAMEYVLDNLNMPDYATAKGSSLNTAYEAIHSMLESASRKGENRRSVVFLFSDGETTDGSTLKSFSELNSLVHNGAVLGYGTERGGRMKYPGKGYIKDVSTGKVALSHLDEASLRQIANDLGLSYVHRNEDFSGSLGSRLQNIRRMSREVALRAGDRTGFQETYHYFAGGVFAVLLVWLFLTINRGGVA